MCLYNVLKCLLFQRDKVELHYIAINNNNNNNNTTDSNNNKYSDTSNKDNSFRNPIKRNMIPVQFKCNADSLFCTLFQYNLHQLNSKENLREQEYEKGRF